MLDQSQDGSTKLRRCELANCDEVIDLDPENIFIGLYEPESVLNTHRQMKLFAWILIRGYFQRERLGTAFPKLF